MAAPTTTFELIEQVLSLGLCDPAKLSSQFPADRTLPDSPKELVQLLVDEGVCTRFQGKMLLAGKGRRLALGKYRLVKPIGRGGMGSVYLGRHTTLRRQVAVKVLRGGSATDPLAAARFEREARAAAALDHPNIVKLFDFGVCHGVPYLVMEYLPGKTAQHMLDASGPMSVPTAVYVISAIANALAHAHARGIVHRDIKPFNVMVGTGGVKLLDMGLARTLEGTDRLTEQANDGSFCGTIDYLSPEQCWGGVVDGRSDIYSLGATLFALLTGRPPYTGSPAEKFAQHQNAPPPSAEQFPTTVPGELVQVVGRMMAKRPLDRFPTCEAVVEALAAWCPAELTVNGSDTDPQRTTSIRRMPPPMPESSTRVGQSPGRRRALRWAIGVGLGMVLATALAVGLAVALSPLVGHSQTSGEWAGEPVELACSVHPVNDVAFTPDGRRLVGVDWSGQVFIWDVETSEILRREQYGQGNNSWLCCAVTADGQILVGGNGSTVYRIDPETGRMVALLETVGPRVWQVSPSSDGKTVVVTSDTAVRLYRLRDGELIREFPSPLPFVWSAVISPDRKLVAAGGLAGENGRGLIRLWDAETGEVRKTLTGHSRDVRSIAFSADSRTLYSVGFDGCLREWDMSTGECRQTITVTDAYIERVIPLPGGRVLLATGLPDPMTEPTRTVRLWDMRTGKEIPGGPAPDDQHVFGMAVSPDGKRFAVGTRSNSARLWAFHPPAHDR